MKVYEYVGCEIKYHDNYLVLHQTSMLSKIKQEFQDEIKSNRKYISPMPIHHHTTKVNEQEGLDKEKQTRYQSGVGSLLYLVKHTRPYISNSVRELTKNMDRANEESYSMMIRVLSYVF